MFETLKMAPPDAILGLAEAFRQDPNPEKINLSVGVYKNQAGTTPILDCVKAAEKKLLAEETEKSYLSIDGSPQYAQLVKELLFEGTIDQSRLATVQAPGGTGALRVAAEFLSKRLDLRRIWCSRPTWGNHVNIFQAAGLEVDWYPYLDDDQRGLDFDALQATMSEIPAADIVCLHACCHNPSGVDPSAEQWQRIAEIAQQQNLVILLDFAYQGFGKGLREDAACLKPLLESGCDLLICNSFSKNFGLYSERVGALTMVAATQEAASAALSHVKSTVRANYSNPPKHGAAIVTTILNDDQLKAQWQQELADMRNRISDMRQRFAQIMNDKNAPRDFSSITEQCGMFSFSGLSQLQVDRLRNEYAIYIVGNGRINVAGITDNNIERLCDAILEVL
jgi:aspartate aminotransferase